MTPESAVGSEGRDEADLCTLEKLVQSEITFLEGLYGSWIRDCKKSSGPILHLQTASQRIGDQAVKYPDIGPSHANTATPNSLASAYDQFSQDDQFYTSRTSKAVDKFNNRRTNLRHVGSACSISGPGNNLWRCLAMFVT